MPPKSNFVAAVAMEVRKPYPRRNIRLEINFIVPGSIKPVSLRMKREKWMLIELITKTILKNIRTVTQTTTKTRMRPSNTI